MLVLVRALCVVLGLRAHAPLESLVVGLWLDALVLPPQRSVG
jgi:hypothetical protein